MGLYFQPLADILMAMNPATGATVSMPDGQIVLDITTTGVLAALTVNLPPNPVNGQRAIIGSAAAITLLTIAAVANAQGVTPAIRGTLASLSASGFIRFHYNANAATWIRTG